MKKAINNKKDKNKKMILVKEKEDSKVGNKKQSN